MSVIDSAVDEFLQGSGASHSIEWRRPADAPASLTTIEVLLGHGDRALEVAVAVADSTPRADDLRRLWKTRANRGAPVLLVALHADAARGLRASVIGTEGDPAPLLDLSAGRVERIAQAALAEPNRHQAVRTLDRLLSSLGREGLAAGLINSGLFATHELRDGVPRRPDWKQACERSVPLLGTTGRALLDALGFKVESRGSTLLALADDVQHHAIAVVLDETESFDRTSPRFGGVSPVSQALAQAQRERLPWVVALRRNQIRLYPADPDVGVGRKGLTETYVELDLALLDDSEAGYLWLIFSPEALSKGGSVEEILHNSSVYATDLGARLRNRIYEDVVPRLAVAVARRMGAKTETGLQEAYHRALVILFRLLFVAYAEDRGLLPFGTNERYTRNALKTYAQDFVKSPDLELSPESTSIWDDLVQVWNVIDAGDPAWGVPAYNGGLFSRDPVTHPEGAAINEMRLTNAEIGPALKALLVDTDEDGVVGPVDFRSLSVREFGTIYEGLLESSLSIAPVDLTLDRQQTYVPAKDGDEVVVAKGEVYYHNASGQRKSTGSYFTKSFAVEHLLDAALEPAITEHLERVKSLIAEDDTRHAAAEAFFDFRVADLAMGSGHFLVAAIDRIEARFSAFLADNPLPEVADELRRLEAAARAALGEQGEAVEIEPSLLLRRQIARRCIYGLDINLMAVELARLAIWIHTFVPGLPMSSLDHNLVHGNSLTGIGSVGEALDILAPPKTSKHAGAQFAQMTTFSLVMADALEKAKVALAQLAGATEATKAEVREAEVERQRALAMAADAKALMDVAVCVRLGLLPEPDDAQGALASLADQSSQGLEAREQITALVPAHFPFLFPEVFVRKNPGFDVIIGNPPWEKVRWEAAPFWTGVFPGLMALPDKARDEMIAELRASHPVEAEEERREISRRELLQRLFRSAYSLRGGTHLEYAQLFLERSLALLRQDGSLGLVLPRQSMVLTGWKGLREALFSRYDVDVVQCRNKGEWLFEGVEARYMVVFLSARAQKTSSQRRVAVWPAHSPEEVAAVRHRSPLILSLADLERMSDSYAVPWVNSEHDVAVLSKMKDHPRLASGDGWVHAEHDSRWDFRGTGPDKDMVVREEVSPAFRVMMARHVDSYAIRADEPVKQYFAAFESPVAEERGVLITADGPALGSNHPLIVFRHPSRNDDTRTLIATALPEHGWVYNAGSVHALRHIPGTDPQRLLALLGLLNTAVEDWWARRFVDRHVTAPIVNHLPLPEWRPENISMVATIVSTLLARNGFRRLAGGTDVRENAEHIGRSSLELRADLEVAAARGYGLVASDMEAIFSDFTERGVEPELRAMVLAALA